MRSFSISSKLFDRENTWELWECRKGIGVCSEQTTSRFAARAQENGSRFRQIPIAISDLRRSRPYLWIATTISWTIWVNEVDPRIKRRNRVWWQGRSTILSGSRRGNWLSGVATSYSFDVRWTRTGTKGSTTRWSDSSPPTMSRWLLFFLRSKKQIVVGNNNVKHII